MRNNSTADQAILLRSLVAAVLVGSSLLAACSYPRYLRQAREDVEPQAVPAMQMAQTLNPEAGRNRKVVSGLDGPAAKNVGDAYVKSFEKKEAPKTAAESFVGLVGMTGQ